VQLSNSYVNTSQTLATTERALSNSVNYLKSFSVAMAIALG